MVWMFPLRWRVTPRAVPGRGRSKDRRKGKEATLRKPRRVGWLVVLVLMGIDLDGEGGRKVLHYVLNIKC
jgi:hypothetical protein